MNESSITIMANPGTGIDIIENLINDKSKEKKPHWYIKNRHPSFIDSTEKAFIRISWARAGSLEYYGIPFQLYGEKTTAFYKSENKSVYHIQIENDVPISYYKIL